MRKICVYTSTRAEFGLLRRLIHTIDKSRDTDLQLLVSGTHLSRDQGYTISEIENEGFFPSYTADIELTDDTPTGICRSMGLAFSLYGDALKNLAPDLVLLLGDRFETLCMAGACLVSGIPIAHIHGGETTEGAIDEAFRHSITKMAHLHFPCAEEYRKRIIQLGESPDRVFNVGALGVENIRRMKLMGKKELEESIGFTLDDPFFLITFHPVTLEHHSAQRQFSQLLKALDAFPGCKSIFTGANADTDGKIINQLILEYANKHPGRVMSVPSLGYLRYLSAMNLCTAVIGNSSSGILEAPVFRKPTISIGDRQKGRIRVKSIIDCPPESFSIEKAIEKALSMEFIKHIQNQEIPFAKPGTADAIFETIISFPLDGLLKKKFYDIAMEECLK